MPNAVLQSSSLEPVLARLQTLAEESVALTKEAKRFALTLPEWVRKPMKVLAQGFSKIDQLALQETQECNLEQLEKNWEVINELETHLKSQKLSDEQKKGLENYRLCFIELVSNALKPYETKADKIEKITKFKIARKIAFWALVVVGVVQDSIANYLFFETTLLLIPGIISPIVIAISLFMTLACVIFFVAVEIASMKKALGIAAEDQKEKRRLGEVYVSEVDELKKVNDILLDRSSEKKMKEANEDYTGFANLAKRFNKLMRERKKSENMPKLQGKWSRKLGGVAFIFLGLLMTGAGSYYMASGLIASVAAALVGTPVGWIIISLLIIASLAFFLALYGRSTFLMMNPEIKQQEALEKSLNNFPVREDSAFDSAPSQGVEHVRGEVASLVDLPSRLPISSRVTTNLGDNDDNSIATTLSL